MTKLEIARFGLSTGIHGLAVLAFAVAVHLEASRRSKVANFWYLVFGCAFIAGLSYNLNYFDSGIANAPFLFAGIDVRTALAAAIWPVALWAAAEHFSHLQSFIRYSRWMIPALVGGLAIQAGRADFFEVAFGYAGGAAIAWNVIRMGAVSQAPR